MSTASYRSCASTGGKKSRRVTGGCVVGLRRPADVRQISVCVGRFIERDGRRRGHTISACWISAVDSAVGLPFSTDPRPVCVCWRRRRCCHSYVPPAASHSLHCHTKCPQ